MIFTFRHVWITGAKAWAEHGLTCVIVPRNWLALIRLLFLICPVSILPPSSLGAMMAGLSEIPTSSTWALGEIRVHDLSAEGEGRRVTKIPGGTTASESEIEALISGILKDYRDNAYLLSRMQHMSMDIDSLARKADLDVYVSRGPRCYISKISLRGNRSISDELFSRETGLVVGVALPEQTLQAGLEKVVEWYRDNGYPYAELTVEHFSIDAGGGVELEIVFEEGKRVRVGNITVEGNRLTRKNVVLLQFGIKPGDSFSMMEIEKGRERLITSDLYSGVGEINFIRSDNPYKVDLEVIVEEEKPNSFSGAMGLVPGIGGRVKPTGTMHLVLGNLWGTGRKTTIKWMGRGEGNSQLDLFYREPWIGGSQVSGEFRFTQELRDTSFSRLELAFAGTGPISRRYGVRLGVEHQSIYSVIGTQTGGERNSRLSLLTGVYRSATSGSMTGRMWAMDLEFLLGRRKIEGVSFGELEGNGRLLTTLWSGRGKDLRLNIGGRFIDSPIRPVPDYQLFSLGGSETIRGYAEDRIWGNRAIWERIEFGFGVNGDSRYLLFYDLGVVDTAGDGQSGALLQGFGTGVRVASKIGVMKIDYALRRGLGPLEGRLHAGWSQDF